MPLAVLIQGINGTAAIFIGVKQTVVVSTSNLTALNILATNHAKTRSASRPNGSLVVLQQGEDRLCGERGVLNELALVPTDQPVQRADPKAAIACSQQRQDVGARQRRAHAGSRGDKPNAIKANQAKFRGEPKIAVSCLHDRVDPALQTRAIGPGGVRVSKGVLEYVRGESDRISGKQEERSAKQERAIKSAPMRCGRGFRIRRTTHNFLSLSFRENFSANQER